MMSRWMERASSLSDVSKLPSRSDLPSRDDLLHAIGLEVRRSRGRALAGGASLFMLGVMAGGLVAVLLAPQTGAELRSRLQERVRRSNGGEELGPTHDRS